MYRGKRKRLSRKQKQIMNQMYSVPRPFGQIDRYAGTGGYGQETKTCDFAFVPGMYVQPYAPDLLNWTPMPVAINATNIQALNLITQGPGVCQRIGNKISMKSIRMRFYLQETAANEDILYSRLMVVYDRQTNGVYPPVVGVNGVLSRMDATNTIQAGTLTSNIDVNSLERYIVLSDDFKIISTLQAGALTRVVGPTNQSAFMWDKYIKLKDLETLFRGNVMAGNPEIIADVITGGIYLMSLANVSNVATSFAIVGDIRTRFHDN